jgi:hypothetical protein
MPNTQVSRLGKKNGHFHTLLKALKSRAPPKGGGQKRKQVRSAWNVFSPGWGPRSTAGPVGSPGGPQSARNRRSLEQDSDPLKALSGTPQKHLEGILRKPIFHALLPQCPSPPCPLVPQGL